LLTGWLPNNAAGQTARLNPRIGRANQKLYEAITAAKDWKNPYLIFLPDEIEVIARGPCRKRVSFADLPRTLIDLPVAAWPYGRVVAMRERASSV